MSSLSKKPSKKRPTKRSCTNKRADPASSTLPDGPVLGPVSVHVVQSCSHLPSSDHSPASEEGEAQAGSTPRVEAVASLGLEGASGPISISDDDNWPISYPSHTVIRSKIDSKLNCVLPDVVEINGTSYALRGTAWGFLSSDSKQYICRFCFASLSEKDPNLALLSHILGHRYYRRDRMLCRSKTSFQKCQQASQVASRQADADIGLLLRPLPVPPPIQLTLPSLSSSSQTSSLPQASVALRGQPQLSFMTTPMLLTRAILFVADTCTPFSVFDAPSFQNYVAAAIEMAKKPKFQLPRAHHVRNHIDEVHKQLLTELSQRLCERQGMLHVSIDSCTFNSTKCMYNVLLSDPDTEWHLGHLSLPAIARKDSQAHCNLFKEALHLVDQHSFKSTTPSEPPPPLLPLPSDLSQENSLFSLFASPTPSLSSVSEDMATESSFLNHPVATLTVDGAPVNVSALKLLREKIPDVVGLVCTVHGLNLLMGHLVGKTPWMKKTLKEAKKVIKFFKNRQRPRDILRKVHDRSLKLPPKTRFCYSLLALQSLSAATQALMLLACASITVPDQRSQIQTEWIKYRDSLTGKDEMRFTTVHSLIREDDFYVRLDALIKILLPIYSLLRVFDRACLGGCGWVFCAILHLRHVLIDAVTSDSQAARRSSSDTTTALELINKRIEYLATEPIVLAFFLNPPAVFQTPPHLFDGLFVKPNSLASPAQHAMKLANNFLNGFSSNRPPLLQSKIKEEFGKYLDLCHSLRSKWGPEQESYLDLHFPHLSSIRKRLISSPAVSSVSERSFSTTRRIETPVRNRIDPSITEKLTFININMRPKTPKTPIGWEDIKHAINNDSDRSRLNVDIDELRDDDDPLPPSPSIETSGDDHLPSAVEGDQQLFQQTQASTSNVQPVGDSSSPDSPNALTCSYDLQSSQDDCQP